MSPNIITNIAVDFFGASISLIIFLYLMLGENRKIRQNRLFAHIVLCNFAILFLDAVSWSIDGMPGRLVFFGERIVSFLGYIFMYLIVGTFTYYLKEYLVAKGLLKKKLVNGAIGLCVFAVLMVIVSQFGGLYYFFDEGNLYHRGQLYWVSQVLVFAMLALNMIVVITHRSVLNRKECISFFGYLLLPLLLNVLHIVYYDLSWSCVGTTLAVVVIYAGIQHEQTKQLARQEIELSESKIAIMLSQIQPHFLYNSLNTIGDLCVTDPAMAQETVFEFSDYLRVNMDALTAAGLVSFDKELNHVKTYLSLEKKRFDERLHVEYDIQARGFLLPPLTVQPIVENAVLHGITVRQNGGLIRITSVETDKGVEITVWDNGVGFELDEEKTGGIYSVKKRLAEICNGQLHVKSSPGEGTSVTIFIPHGEVG